MKITADIQTAFDELRKLNISLNDHEAVINILYEYGNAVHKKATEDAINALKIAML